MDAIPDGLSRLNLLQQSEDRAVEIARLVPNVMDRIRTTGAKRPYSLTSKFLHFLFPELFVIDDSQAALSIWMWSLFAIAEEQPESRQFLSSRLQEKEGSGYAAMVRFYHQVWHSCTAKEQDRATLVATLVESYLRDGTGMNKARVTVLDIIDKHLWICNGNPIRLGLATIR
jgi:hypothetical protein